VIAALIAAAAVAQPAGAGTAPLAHPFTLTVKVDKDEVTLGEPFLVTIRVEHPPLDVYALPEPLAVDPLGLRGAPSVSRAAGGERAETTFELPLVNVKALEPRLPPLRSRARSRSPLPPLGCCWSTSPCDRSADCRWRPAAWP